MRAAPLVAIAAVALAAAYSATPRKEKEHGAKDPMDFAPDIKKHIETLREVSESAGTSVSGVEAPARRFCMLLFRRLGRDPERTSTLDAARATDDMMRLRAEIINAVQAMYVSAHREKHHAVLDVVTANMMRDTMAYVRAVRSALGDRNVYEGGRGFPSPWSDAADDRYDMMHA